ncbi:MAG TPA: NADH-quinone oxidoreductase subunit C [Polyangiaceae bacterium]|nr:NADH-quinone oxidoreductase subunit C [Polyangiaceae bacterium]
MSQLVLDKLRERFGAAILETHSQFGDDTAVVEPAAWRSICLFLREDPDLDFDMPVDLCGVDYPVRGRVGAGRMEVVMHLYSVSKRHRVRLKARVGDEDMEGAELDSVVSIWPGMNWLEREVFDMSGVRFRGHPDLRRILMYPEFEGHPLQKTYPADRTQPLVAYRTEDEAGMPLHKLEPFGPDEGMPFGRRATRSEDN